MSEANKERLSGKTTVREIMEVATSFEIVARDFYSALIPQVSKNIRWLVEELAEELDKEMRSIINENPSLSVTQAAVLTALDKADTCKKSTASSDNLRAQIKDYLEDSARARMEVDVARREIERLNREISSLRERIAENK